MAREIWVSIGSINDLLADGTEQLSEPMVTCHQYSPNTTPLREISQALGHGLIKISLKIYLCKISFNYPRDNGLCVSLHTGCDKQFYISCDTDTAQLNAYVLVINLNGSHLTNGVVIVLCVLLLCCINHLSSILKSKGIDTTSNDVWRFILRLIYILHYAFAFQTVSLKPCNLQPCGTRRRKLPNCYEIHIHLFSSPFIQNIHSVALVIRLTTSVV